MFPFQRKVWLDKWSSLQKTIYGMFTPPGKNCLTCNRITRTGSGLLCTHCERTIPWIDNIYCTRCGQYRECRDCSRRQRTTFISNRSAVRYSAEMKQLLATYKYKGNERLLTLLVEMLAHGYRMHEQDLGLASTGRRGVGSRDPGFVCATFVPVSEERLRERGFNQAEQLARRFGERRGIPVIALLQRIRDTGRMSQHSRRQRLMHLQDAFALDEEGCRQFNAYAGQLLAAQGSTDSGRSRIRILLIDDVYTTGTTMTECASTILQHYPVEIYGLTWAR